MSQTIEAYCKIFSKIVLKSSLPKFHTLPVLVVVGNPRLCIAVLVMISSTKKLSVFEDTLTERGGAAGNALAPQ